MSTFSIEFPGLPIPQARPRFARGFVYDPCKAKKKELQVLLSKQLEGFEPYSVPLCAYVTFYFPFPKSASRAFRKKHFHTPYQKKPDIDNLIKFYLDLMNFFVYTDDSLIYKVVGQKVYACEGKTKILVSTRGEDMIKEHVLVYKKELTLEDVHAVARKASALGYAGREIYRVFEEEEGSLTHLYFECDPIKQKSSIQKIVY